MNRYWQQTIGVGAMTLLLMVVLSACAAAVASDTPNPCALTASLVSSPVKSAAASDPGTTTFVTSTWVIDGAPNKFSRPTALARDEQGNLYVVDGGNHVVQKFDCNGHFLTKFGGRGSGEGQFAFFDSGGHFGAVTTDRQSHIFVADHNYRIQKFTTDGKFLMQWGSQGSGDGQFGAYLNLAADTQGNVYVVDPDNQRVQKFDGNGKFLAAWQMPKCSFFSPKPVSIAVNTQGEVYVTDAQSHCIQKFDSSGNFLSTVGKFAETDLPVGLTLDAQGSIYVTDDQIGVIWKFDSAGNLLATWNSADSQYGRLDSPGGIVVDGQGNVYVVEVRGERIRKFAQP